MHDMKKRPAYRILLFAIGGICYGLIEVLWRGHTHWSMVLLGGACFRLIGGIGERFSAKGPLFRSALCMTVVTACEFICGCIVNLWWGLHVWDYSARPLHLLGQICPLFALLWGLLSLPVMPLYRAVAGRLSSPVAVPTRSAHQTAALPQES